MAASSLTSMGEEDVLPSTNSEKPYQYLVEIIGLDHNYCRPWSDREKVPHASPVRTLFSHQTENEVCETKKPEEKKVKDGEEFIDVETVDEAPRRGPGAINMQYDVVKSRIVMSECEKYVSSASSKRTPDTWEELICRTGWTTQQNVLFDKVLKIVSAYRLAWLTYQESANEPILRRVALDKATKRVRQILSRIEWDTKLTTWLHNSMVDGLSIPLLACYLDIVQTLRSKLPTLVDKMIAGGATNRRVSPASSDNLTALLKRPWDATVALSSFQRPRKITGTPLLLIVPGGPTTNATGNSTKRSRFWHQQLSHFGKVIPVTMHLSNSARGVSVGQCLDHMIGAVQAKVLELKNHFPNRPVVLIGWATGALVSFQVSLKESVCAVVCLGFPLLGVDGIRGGTGDPFLDSKTPTMFIFGSLSTSCSLPDIEEFRAKLLADTSLLFIPGADDQLRLTSAMKKKEGVTQSVVDRRIMDDIGEFLNKAVSNLNDDLHPRLNYFDFDDIENQRKKPKTEYRKRPAGGGTGSTTAPKKPRGRTPKAANGEGSVPKKPKTVKVPKKTAVNKPTIPDNGQTPGPPTVRSTGGIPIAPLRATHPTIPGVLQGVPLTSVPISAVGVPLTGVPVSRVSIPGVLSGVNIPVSGVNVPVSAVIKQGSLGGRSFVFPGAISGSGMSTSGIATMGANTHHLKIVVNPTGEGGITLTGSDKPGASSPATMQYKTAIVTASHPAVKSSSANANSKAPPTSVQPISMTSSSTSSTTTSSVSIGVSQTASTSAISKPSAVSRTVVTVPKSSIISGQPQYVVHHGQLSAVGKHGSTITSSSATPANAAAQPMLTLQSARVNIPVSGRPQSNVASTSGKHDTARVSHVGLGSTQASASLAKKAPSTPSTARTIQVGVKRTVTYNPSSQPKNVTVVSRSLPSDTFTTHVSSVSHISLERLKAKLKTIQNLTGLQIQADHIQSIKSPTSAGLTTCKLTPQTCSQSSPQTNVSISIHGNTKSITTATATLTTTKVHVPTSSAAGISTPKSTAQTLQSSSHASLATETHPNSTATEKAVTQSVQKPTSEAVQTTVAAAAKPNEQPEKQPSPQVTAKPSAVLSIGKPNLQVNSKPTPHFIQVPASAKTTVQTSSAHNVDKASRQTLFVQNVVNTSGQNTAKTNAQTPSTQKAVKTSASAQTSIAQTIQGASKNSTQSGNSQSAASFVGSSVTAQGTQKKESIDERGGKNEDVKDDQSDSSSMSGSRSDEERFVERINDIVKEVVGGQQRTTRQSARRLVAAAKLAEVQNKRVENSETCKDEDTKSN